MPLRQHQDENDDQQHRAPMSDDEVERVANRVFQMFQAEVGKGVFKAALWMMTVAFLAFLAWAGFIHPAHAAQTAFHLQSKPR